MAKRFVRENPVVWKPHYLAYWMYYKYITNKDKVFKELANEDFPDGQKVRITFINHGGTRSSKTFDSIHLIYKLLTDPENRNKNLYCTVYRKELVLCRQNTLKDFKECFNLMNLIPDVDYVLTGENSGSSAKISLAGNTIEFKGYPEIGEQASKSFITYINEILESDSEKQVDNILQRCTGIAILDANPDKTFHFSYDRKDRLNYFYSKTTYLDNFHLDDGQRGDWETKCPWDLNDSEIVIEDAIAGIPIGLNENFHNGFRRRKWLKPECKPNEIYNPEVHRRINIQNEKTGSIDRAWWLTMGEGIPCAREGAVFPYVNWIDSFPDTGFEFVWYSVDFGYTSDPTVLVRTGYEKGKKLTCDIMVCEPTNTPEKTFILFRHALDKEAERRKNEGIKDYNTFWICCESQDNYMGDNWVEELNKLAYYAGLNYNFFKISKGSIAGRVDLAKSFDITLVDHPRMRIEQQNYIYLEGTSQPDPKSKFCDCWDAIGYGVWHYGHGLS